jgi:hypothetical protein
MQIKADNEKEALGLAFANMPNNSTLTSGSVDWTVTRTMGDVWTLFIRGAADKARLMGHVEPRLDTKWYDSPLTAAEAVTYGHHTAYGQAV